MSDNYWTTPHADGWCVKKEGAARASYVFKTQAEAWERAKELARKHKSEAYLQGENGQIRERNSYGNDPRSSKG